MGATLHTVSQGMYLAFFVILFPFIVSHLLLTVVMPSYAEQGRCATEAGNVYCCSEQAGAHVPYLTMLMHVKFKVHACYSSM